MAASRQPAAPHVDQLQAAAAEVAGKAVGRMNARHDAERGKLGLPLAGQHVDFLAEDAFGLRDEVGTVLGLARRRRGDDLDMRNAELIDQRAKAPERPQRPLHRVGRELAGRGERAAEAAQHLLVEQRRRRPAGILVDDEPDRVRADIDDRNGGSIVFQDHGRLGLRRLARLDQAREARRHVLLQRRAAAGQARVGHEVLVRVERFLVLCRDRSAPSCHRAAPASFAGCPSDSQP